MSNANQPSLTQPDAGQRSGLVRLMLEQWPYVLLFVAVIAGVAFTDMRLEFALLYWQILIRSSALLRLRSAGAAWATTAGRAQVL